MYGEKMLDHMTQKAYDEMRKKQKANNKFAEMMHNLVNDPIRYDAWRKNISRGKTGVKLSDKHKQVLRLANKRPSTYLKRLQTLYPNVDFHQFDINSYINMSHYYKRKYLNEYRINHIKK